MSTAASRMSNTSVASSHGSPCGTNANSSFTVMPTPENVTVSSTSLTNCSGWMLEILYTSNSRPVSTNDSDRPHL